MTQNGMRIAFIPAYMPEEHFLDIVGEAQQAGFEVIAVDDGSGGTCAQIFQEASKAMVLLTHPQNRGKGSAIKTGLRYIAENYRGDYTVVTIDADGQHRIQDALRVCEAAEQRPDTLVLGNRELIKNVPFRSRFGNTVTRGVFSLSTGLHVHDTQTGLRAFSNELLPVLLEIPGERYEYEMNVLLAFARNQRPIREIEISTVYFDNNGGSHFDTVKDSYRIYKEILKFSASSFVCFLLDYGLYSLMTLLTGGLAASVSLTVSNIIARVASASVNYTINRKVVFKSQNGVLKSALQYFALAAGILAGNTFVLNLLVAHVGLNPYTAKALTEVLFFFMSWLVQRRFIFAGKGEAPHGKP